MSCVQATAELFDEEGFLKTGDVVEQRDEDTFIWLDRVKNIIKLAQVLPLLDSVHAALSIFSLLLQYITCSNNSCCAKLWLI